MKQRIRCWSLFPLLALLLVACTGGAEPAAGSDQVAQTQQTAVTAPPTAAPPTEPPPTDPPPTGPPPTETPLPPSPTVEPTMPPTETLPPPSPTPEPTAQPQPEDIDRDPILPAEAFDGRSVNAIGVFCFDTGDLFDYAAFES